MLTLTPLSTKKRREGGKKEITRREEWRTNSLLTKIKYNLRVLEK